MLARAPTPKMLARPAAIRPQSNRPRRPPKGEACGVSAAGDAAGLVMDFCIGSAVRGAVLVVGGGVKVRVPRLPKLLPLPTRAEATSAVTSASVARMASAPARRDKRMGDPRS